MTGPSPTVTRTDLPLVGRAAELQAVDSALARAAGGEGSAIVISGEAGAGKTRLAEEVARLARARGFQVLRGSAYPADRGLAYTPLVEAFGRHLREMEPPQRAKTVRGLDSLGLLLEDLGLPPPPPLGDPALERTRLLESLTRLLDRMSRDRPLLLIVDDLHWADQETLRFVSYAGRDLRSFRVVLVGAYSVEYLEEAPAVAEMLAALRHAGEPIDLRLAALADAEVGELSRAFLGGEPTSQTLAAIVDQTAGNPLFVLGLLEELVAAGLLTNSEGRWALSGPLEGVVPRVANEIIAARLDRLDSQERRLVEVVALGGAEVPHHLLGSVCGLSEEGFSSALTRLIARGLIGEHVSAGRVTYTCAHPLIARVAYRHLPEAVRHRFHASFIEGMEGEGEHFQRLAWHYERAGPEVDQPRRLGVLAEAGRRALQRFANEEAAASLQTALSVARRLDRSDLVPEILEDLGEAWSRLGEDRAAVEVWEEALAAHHDAEPVARLHRKLALTESNLGRFDASERHVTAGLEALGEDSGEESIELEGVRMLNLFRRGETTAGMRLVEGMAVTAEETASPRGRLLAATGRVGAYLADGDYSSAASEASRALDLARAVNDPVSEQQVLAFQALIHLSLGDLAALDQVLEANLALTERIGIPLREYRIQFYRFAGDFYAGRWDSAEEVVIEAGLLATRVEMPRNQVVLDVMPVLLDVHRGDFERAGERLSAARRALATETFPEVPVPIVVEVMAAAAALEAGRPEEALETISGLGGRYLFDLIPPWGLAFRGEAEARCGEPGWETTADELARLGPASSLPAAWSLRVQALGAGRGGATAEAATLWAEAAKGFAALGMPFEAARCRLERAEVSPEQPHVEEVRAAHGVFVGVGARGYADRAARLLRSLGERVPSPAGPGVGGLTARQAAVAELVAQGLTNAEIAERLYISRRTVTTHLEHIYRELGIHTRTALTRYVIEGGLEEHQ